jgi:hypothetical protein
MAGSGFVLAGLRFNIANGMSELPSLREEIQPFIVFRIAGGQAECATWQVENGSKALALFLSAESAEAYRTAAGFGGEWRVVRPPRAGLLELLRASRQTGIALAVLDPDRQKARRVFDIAEILAAVDSL